jgi:hypothetical protein
MGLGIQSLLALKLLFNRSDSLTKIADKAKPRALEGVGISLLFNSTTGPLPKRGAINYGKEICLGSRFKGNLCAGSKKVDFGTYFGKPYLYYCHRWFIDGNH